MTSAESKVLSLALARSNWTEQADAWAAQLPHDSPGLARRFLHEAVTSGTAELFHITRAGKVVGMVVAEVDHGFNPPELLVRAGYSSDHTPITPEIFGLLEQIARERGCGTLRFHTMRGGLIARAEAAGWRVSEIILRKNVP